MKIDVTEVIDHEDGSCTITFDLETETLNTFARIGLLKVLTDAANDSKVMNEEPPKELRKKNSVIPCLSSNPNTMCDGCDCWKSSRAYSS